MARGIEKIPSRRARGAPRHRADAAAGRKCGGRAGSRQSGRRGVRPRRGAGGDGEHPARHRRRGRAAADAHRGLRHEARAGAGYDRRAQRERGHEAQERDGRRRYGQRHAGGRGDEPRLSALRRGACSLRGRRQRGRAPCRDAGGQRPDGAAERQDHRITGETMKIIIFGRKNMKKLWKRNMVAGAVLLLVCGAIFLNGRYAQQVEETDKILGQATLVDGTEGDAEEVSGEALPGDYFATARLTRQQARDSALSLLQEASGAAEGDEAAAAEAAQSIQTLAAYTLAEAQIENMITAKGYTDCVVFMADDGVSVVVSAGEDGLQTEDIAKITDIVKQETELTADCIKILEVN